MLIYGDINMFSQNQSINVDGEQMTFQVSDIPAMVVSMARNLTDKLTIRFSGNPEFIDGLFEDIKDSYMTAYGANNIDDLILERI